MNNSITNSERIRLAIELAKRLAQEIGYDKERALLHGFDYWKAPSDQWDAALEQLNKELK